MIFFIILVFIKKELKPKNNGSRTTGRWDFKPKGLQAEVLSYKHIKKLTFHLQIVNFQKFSQVYLILSVNDYNAPLWSCIWHPLFKSAGL